MADRVLAEEIMKLIHASTALDPVSDPGPDCKVIKAAEIKRYLAEEMAESEQVELERHAYGCPACLRAIATTMADLKIADEERSARFLDRTLEVMDRIDSMSNVVSKEEKERYLNRADLSIYENSMEDNVRQPRKQRVGRKIRNGDPE